MGLNLKQVLDDATTYPDALEFQVGTDKVTLKELRTARAQMEAELKQKTKAAEDEYSKVTELTAKAVEIKANLEKQLADAMKAGSGNKGNNNQDDDFSDAFWNPVRKAYDAKIAAIDENLKKFSGTMEQLRGAMEKATTVWAEDRWRNQFERLRPRLEKIEKHKNMTYEEVRDYAAKNRLLDVHGLPSVEKAILDLTAASEKEVELKEAFERGRREGEMRGRLAATGRPTSASGPKKPEKSAVAEKGLEGLGDDVANDKELSEMLSQLGAVDPSDFGGTPS